MNDSIARVQGAIDRFSAGLQDDRGYVERRADDGGHQMLSPLGTWMAERVVEAQQKNFKASKLTINHYTSGWGSQL